MKRLLAALTALTLTVPLVACGSKDSSSSKDTSSSTSASDTGNSVSSDDASTILGLVAGTYTVNGTTRIGSNVPQEFEDLTIDGLNEKFESDPITISGEGVLHYDGADYQLIPEELKDETATLSVEGSGFNLKEFKRNGISASKDYDGPAAVKYEVSHATINGEDTPMIFVSIYFAFENVSDSYGAISMTPVTEDDDGDADFSYFKDKINSPDLY